MYCTNCGALQEDKANACTNCGASMTPVAAQQQNVNNEGYQQQGEQQNQQPFQQQQPYQPYPQQQGYQQYANPSATNQGNGQTWLVPNIIVAVVSLCCCQISIVTGIIGIIFAAMVDGKRRIGDYASAQRNVSMARVLFFVSLGLFVLGLIVSVISVLVYSELGSPDLNRIFERIY